MMSNQSSSNKTALPIVLRIQRLTNSKPPRKRGKLAQLGAASLQWMTVAASLPLLGLIFWLGWEIIGNPPIVNLQKNPVGTSTVTSSETVQPQDPFLAFPELSPRIDDVANQTPAEIDIGQVSDREVEITLPIPISELSTDNWAPSKARFTGAGTSEEIGSKATNIRIRGIHKHGARLVDRSKEQRANRRH